MYEFYRRPKVETPVNYEVKGQLAKLLATEDIIIENRKVPTASFDVQRRILTLPLWEKASEVVYDLLVGHEVGHALFTPEDNWKIKYPSIPMSFVNILEDVRIEKLMKRKYPGLLKTFRKGYEQLAQQDFFEIAEVELETLGLPDRINLHYKIGAFVKIPFTVAESIYLRRASETTKFEEVLNLAKDLAEYMKSQEENLKRTSIPVGSDKKSDEKLDLDTFDPTSEINDSDNDEGQDLESERQKRPDLGKDSTQYEEVPDDLTNDGGDGWDETVTDTSLKENIEKLTNPDDSTEEPNYVEVPKLNLKTVITSSEEIYEYLEEWYELCNEKADSIPDVFVNVDDEYRKFRKSAQKEVNYLVKEFECKKSASAYARAATSRTGVLDTTKLQTYKFNDDLFRKVTVLPDGKNHGLVFVLDWSGSMSDVLLDTVKQLYNLVWFCRKVSIPFEVYAFTNEWIRKDDTYNNLDGYLYNRPTLPEHMERKEWFLQVDSDFCMMNVLSSKSKSKDLERHMHLFFRLTTSLDHRGRSDYYRYPYQYPHRLCLSGTPLNEALVALNSILPDFQKRNKVEKVQCITLTDGEAHALRYSAMHEARYDDSEPFMGYRTASNGKTFIRDRKTGKTYFCNVDYHHFTAALLNQLRDRFPTTNFIGIRVMAPRDASHFIRKHCDYDMGLVQKMVQSWKKTKSFVIPNAGYNAYFGLSSNSLNSDTEFEVDQDATKTQIKRAFNKSLKGKKMNKKVLGEFISLIA